MQITSLDQLKNIKKDIAELPAFEDGTPFIAELKRPNMFFLMAQNKIPNTLMSVVMDVFQKGKGNEVVNNAMDNPKELQELINLMIIIAKESLVNPSYTDLENAGITLNEMQLSALFTYAQGGVKSIENFCQE